MKMEGLIEREAGDGLTYLYHSYCRLSRPCSGKTFVQRVSCVDAPHMVSNVHVRQLHGLQDEVVCVVGSARANKANRAQRQR